jgi:hypothetical protein
MDVVRVAQAVTVALVALLALSCSGQVRPAPAPTSQDHSCPSSGAAPSEGCWHMILPLGSGGFPATRGSQNRPLWEPALFPLTLAPHIAYDGALWTVAQTRGYSSRAGLTWIEHTKTDWGERIYQTIVYFKGRLWMYGGLDYQGRTFLNDVWSSSDGITWSKMGTASWSPRGNQTIIVYHDQLWLFGGADHITRDCSTDGFLNDVWVSDDGSTWRQVTSGAPWAPRDKAGVAVFRDELYLVGGRDTADVWRSSNGQEWTQLVDGADWGARHDFALLRYDGRLWVFGGWREQSSNALNDVWSSPDGTGWSRQTDHAPWGPRSPISVVFQNNIWIYSGKHTGFDDNWGGDLWQMSSVGVGPS